MPNFYVQYLLSYNIKTNHETVEFEFKMVLSALT